MEVKMENNIDNRIADIMFAFRKESGFSAAEVANKIGITPSHMSLVENKKRGFTMDLFWRWCEALERKPHHIIAKLWEKDHPRSHTSKKKQVERLKKKSFGELTAEELEFLAKHGGQ